MSFVTGLVIGFLFGALVTAFVGMVVIISIGAKMSKKEGGYIETTEEINT